MENTKNIQKTIKGKVDSNSKLSYSENFDLPKQEILGVGVTNMSKEKILEYIIKSVEKNGKPYYIVTPNPEMIMLSRKNSSFKNALNSAKIAINDGVGLAVGGYLLGTPLKERFTGVQLVENLCEKVADWPITVGFLGAGSKIAEKASECLKEQFPGLKVAFAEAEWDESFKSKIDILFVAFGAPKQEFWMAEHVGKIPVKVMAGVGGAFDQIANPSLRPPRLVQSLGLGWLYRLIRQPWRIKRQLALLEFGWIVFKARVTKNKK